MDHTTHRRKTGYRLIAALAALCAVVILVMVRTVGNSPATALPVATAVASPRTSPPTTAITLAAAPAASSRPSSPLEAGNKPISLFYSRGCGTGSWALWSRCSTSRLALGGPRVTTVCHTMPTSLPPPRALAARSRLRWRAADLRWGLPWLAEAEAATGLCAALAACIPEWRRGHGAALARGAGPPARLPDRLRLRRPERRRHAAPRPAAQAGLRPAAGERRGPGQPADLLAAGERGRPARLHAPGARPGRRLPAGAWAGRAARAGSCWTWTAPTTRRTGRQEGTAYHGYYRQHMYHPLLVFDGDTEQLITAVLRPGNAHASRGVVSVLRVLVAAPARALAGADHRDARRQRLRGARACIAYCEREGIDLHHRAGAQRAAGRRWPRRCWPRPRRGGPPARGEGPPGRRDDATRPAAGTARAGSCTRPRPWPRAPTPASWSPPAPTPRGPLRLVRGPRRAGGLDQGLQARLPRRPPELTTASGPTSSACCCTPPPTGCSTPCAAGSARGPPAPATRHPAPAPAQGRRARPRTRSPGSASTSPAAIPASPSGHSSPPPSHAVNNPG